MIHHRRCHDIKRCNANTEQGSSAVHFGETRAASTRELEDGAPKPKLALHVQATRFQAFAASELVCGTRY